MEVEKLQEILAKHAKWLRYEVGGVKADLQGVDLRLADLRGADLRFANLQGADLQRANLQNADLRFANLQQANLQETDLQDARLNWVNWHEIRNIKVYVAGLQSSRENAQLTYIPSIDVATTGCWQSSWSASIEQIHSVYADGTQERKAYDLAIKYIEDQLALDDVTTATTERSQDGADWLVQKSDFISKDASTKAQ